MNQIFQTQYDCNLLFDFLELNCSKTCNYYLLNHDLFKKYLFFHQIEPFIESLIPYYKSNKAIQYLNKKHTYKSFLTIIRQICKHCNIPFVNKIKYNKSQYSIEYYIYFS